MTHFPTDMGEPDLVTLAALWSARLGRTLHPGQVDVMLNDLDSLRVWSLPDDGTLSAPLVEVEDDVAREVKGVFDEVEEFRAMMESAGVVFPDLKVSRPLGADDVVLSSEELDGIIRSADSDSLADLCKRPSFVGDDEDPQPSDVISFEAIRPAPFHPAGLCQCNRCWRMVRAADLSRGWCRTCHAELGLGF